MQKITIPVQKTTHAKAKPNSKDLGFGRFFTDHMFLVNYSTAKGWYNPRVVPYEPLPMDPGASVLHYGQALFEGMKAFKQKNGDVVLFRPEFNWKRMQAGAERLCMQCPPMEMFVEGVKALVQADQDWIPTDAGCSLYIRPTLIGTEAFLGVRPAEEYLFFVILSPVSSYYSEGAKPVKIWVEEEYLRAAPGGLGATKAAANYAASLKAAYEAKKHGYSQVLWLDVDRKHIEEVGTMNVFFAIGDDVITPALDGTILGGGVRDSVISVLKSWGKKVIERKITIQEIKDAHAKGLLKEVFGTGTAAVISPVGEFAAKNWNLQINNMEMGPIASQLYTELTEMQNGSRTDTHGWLQKI